MSVSCEVFQVGHLTPDRTCTFSELPKIGERLAFHDPADPPTTPPSLHGDVEVVEIVRQVSVAGSEEVIRIFVNNI